ncbi:MAG: F0F1 ATP synthase subunit A, partial [Planctomycetales bacterium]
RTRDEDGSLPWSSDGYVAWSQFVHNHRATSGSAWQGELSGKCLIPQPFGVTKNLYEPGSGFCISKFMILETVVALIVAALFICLARRTANGERPKGRLWNMLEAMLEFLRNDVARSAIGAKDGDKFLPLLWTIFFFVLGCNLIGMVPWMGTPTGEFGATLALALCIILTTFGAGSVFLGPVGFWTNMIPHIELPWWMKPLEWVIRGGIFVIEIVGLFIKHGVLAIRLLANMAAGHLVIGSILALIIQTASYNTGIWALAAAIGIPGTVAINCLELLVAFLQAYVFTFLSALFIGAAIHHH